MISGERDMLVIDPQFSLSEAHRLAAEILESKKNLALIYVTHPHPDHLFGLAVLTAGVPVRQNRGAPGHRQRAPRPPGPPGRSSGSPLTETTSPDPIRSCPKNFRRPR